MAALNDRLGGGWIGLNPSSGDKEGSLESASFEDVQDGVQRRVVDLDVEGQRDMRLLRVAACYRIGIVQRVAVSIDRDRQWPPRAQCFAGEQGIVSYNRIRRAAEARRQ